MAQLPSADSEQNFSFLELRQALKSQSLWTIYNNSDPTYHTLNIRSNTIYLLTLKAKQHTNF